MGEKNTKNQCVEDEYAAFFERFNHRHDAPLVKEIKTAYRWFIDVMGEDKWVERRGAVLAYFREMSERLFTGKSDVSFHEKDARLAFYDDWIAWYLYLAESLADRPTVDEPAQSSRIWHFFAVIGEHSEKLKQVKGIESKLNDLLVKTINQPDSILFELIVAICYLKNGWEVEFIPETGAHKTPDLKVVKGNDIFYVECKRLAKVTQYSEEERAEWLKRWEMARPLITRYHKPVFFDVIFKTEIVKTRIDVLLGAVAKIYGSDHLVKGKVAVCESDDILVQANLIDMERVDNHLRKWHVKYPSPQLNSLLDDQYDPFGSYTMVCNAKLCTFSNDELSTINVFIDEIEMPFCAKWICLADESVDKKAKDIKRVLVQAVKQAPIGESTIIHIGYETLHGPQIEFARDMKICELISDFDFMGKDIAAIYCHSFQPRLLADENWDFAETVRYFSQSRNAETILEQKLLTDVEGTIQSDDTHWAQDLREMLGK